MTGSERASYRRKFASWLARVGPLLVLAALIEAQVSESGAVFAQHAMRMFATKCGGCHGSRWLTP